MGLLWLGRDWVLRQSMNDYAILWIDTALLVTLLFLEIYTLNSNFFL